MYNKKLTFRAGKQLLNRGSPVHIVSVSEISRAVSMLIYHQLLASQSHSPSLLHCHQFDLQTSDDVDDAADQLLRQSVGQRLTLIVDEAASGTFR
jgi:hypothetical protein